jgi:hypothetical protein
MKFIPSLKPFATLLAILFCSINVNGQKTSFNVNVYSGLFSFRGAGATSASSIETGFYIIPGYTKNVYGTGAAFSYAIEGELQRKTAQHILYGAGLSYEKLTSSVTINKVGFSGDPAYLIYNADGNTRLINTFFNLSTLAGYQFTTGKISLDVLGGLDFATCLSSHEKGSAITENNTTFTTNNMLRKPRLDLRPRIQLKAGYKKMGLILGYSLGLTAYPSREEATTYSRFLRIGFSYTIR